MEVLIHSYLESKVQSFVKYLLWHQNYFGMDYPLPDLSSRTQVSGDNF